jgi:hypothetical protein
MNLQVSHADPMLVADVVENPEYVVGYGNDRHIKATRTLRNDPIADMYAKHKIDAAQYKAAREWQRDAEMAGPRTKSSGHIQEPVDGGGHRITEPSERLEDWKLPENMKRQIEAQKRLIQYATVLGPRQHQLLVLVLDRGLSAWGATAAMFPGDFGSERKRFVATWLKEILSILAREMRLA